ncbi:MAG: response regulator [Paracoccaceae bacterium]
MTLSGLHILLAEDNPTNQLVALQMLESLGATVSLASDGEAALELVRTQRFDVGLIDIEMPKMPGTEVIRHIRAGAGEQAGMPLIALTAYVMREHRAEIDKAGADGVIAKPILSIEDLGQTILSYVVHRQAQISMQLPTSLQPEPVFEAAGGPAHGTPSETAGGPGTIDRAVLAELAAAVGEEVMGELLERLEEDLGAAREAIAEALTAPDLDAIRRATHVLIALGGTIGATALQNASECLNSAVHTGDITRVKRDAPALLVELEAVEDFVRGERQR